MLGKTLLVIGSLLCIVADTQAEDCQLIRCAKGSGWNQSCYDMNTAVCVTCRVGTYQDDDDIPGQCKTCLSCAALSRLQRTPCQTDANTACSGCKKDFFGSECDSDPTVPCRGCVHCSHDVQQQQQQCEDYHQRVKQERERKKKEEDDKTMQRNIGIGFGVAIPVSLILAIVVLIYWRRCRGPKDDAQIHVEGGGGDCRMCEGAAIENGMEETGQMLPAQAQSRETVNTETSGPVGYREPEELWEQLQEQPIFPPQLESTRA